MGREAVTPKQEGMPRGMRIGESVFDMPYLVFDLVACIIFSLQTPMGAWCLYSMAGSRCALVAATPSTSSQGPDASFGVREDTQRKLGLGTAITSVTMTVFYVLLYFIWREIFPNIEVSPAIPTLIFITAAARHCPLPLPSERLVLGQGEPPLVALPGNVPFAITGIPYGHCPCLPSQATLAGTAFGACA